jgi:hypothetical protein
LSYLKIAYFYTFSHFFQASGKLFNKIHLDIKINCEGFYLNGIYENIYTAFENLLDNSFRYAKNVIEITSTDDFVKIYNDAFAYVFLIYSFNLSIC